MKWESNTDNPHTNSQEIKKLDMTRSPKYSSEMHTQLAKHATHRRGPKSLTILG